jgi:hypothetical protein
MTDDRVPHFPICGLRVLQVPIDALAVFSDGLERLVLDFANRAAPAQFLTAW